MVAPSTMSLSHASSQPMCHTSAPHWRQAGRFSTVENAERKLDELRSEGLDAVLSMIDGICVIVREAGTTV